MKFLRKVFSYLTLTASLELVSAECPNACSGHGLCGNKDMCTCDRNWQGSDCSLRTCPFGISHVDISKGDLDSSISIGDSNDMLISGSTVYPFGTTEGFPYMTDTAGNVKSNTGHDYSECSNKGLCDRASGECECLPGYDGTACQRASCPNKSTETKSTPTELFVNQAISQSVANSAVFSGKSTARVQEGECSGHGSCKTISYVSDFNNNNIYELWDKYSSMGCVCDPGYTGADCSERECKYGIDPLWTDDTTARVAQMSVRISTSVSNTLSGQYSIKFFDVFGEDYITTALDLSPDGVLNGVNHCDSVKDALKALPNGVIPTIECSLTAINTDQGFEYTLTFTGNPGKLQQLELDEYLDGSRPTILISSGTYSANVYTKVNGEFVDNFAEKCEGVKLKVVVDSDDTTNAWNADVRPGSLGYLSDLTANEAKLLKACLGHSDYDPDNNIDVANWDKGVVIESDGSPATTYNMIGAFPHAIKVVPVETSTGYDMFTNGEYHLVWYDDSATAGKEFRVANVNNNNNILSEATESYVFTTQGTVQQLAYGIGTELADNPTTGASTDRIVAYFNAYENKIYTNYDTSCENQPVGTPRNHVCVEKGDKLFLVDSCWGAGNSGASVAKTNPFFGGPELSNCPDSTAVNHDTGNIYTVTKVYSVPLSSSASTTDPTVTSDTTLGTPEEQTIVDTFVIEVDANFGWEGLKGDPENSDTALDGSTWSDNTGVVTLFHFTAGSADHYEYVSQCSNRGLCESGSGLCKCFSGYTGDDCSIQNALASP